MIILLFKLILITSIWVLGITIATQPNMVLYSLREWAEEEKEQTGSKIWEAICLCHWCMPSLHSVVGYGFAYTLGILSDFRGEYIFMYPLVVMGSSLLNGIVWAMYQLTSAMDKFFKDINEHNEKVKEE